MFWLSLILRTTCLIINSSSKKIDNQELKKATEIKLLLERICKSKTKFIDDINWRINLDLSS